ncbi:MAG: hypothetical protein K5745_04340 [Saccharofermentans sp.]|nr:hypothetical protein [Saccharofermentans sp.]
MRNIFAGIFYGLKTAFMWVMVGAIILAATDAVYNHSSETAESMFRSFLGSDFNVYTVIAAVIFIVLTVILRNDAMRIKRLLPGMVIYTHILGVIAVCSSFAAHFAAQSSEGWDVLGWDILAIFFVPAAYGILVLIPWIIASIAKRNYD